MTQRRRRCPASEAGLHPGRQNKAPKNAGGKETALPVTEVLGKLLREEINHWAHCQSYTSKAMVRSPSTEEQHSSSEGVASQRLWRVWRVGDARGSGGRVLPLSCRNGAYPGLLRARRHQAGALIRSFSGRPTLK